MADGTPVLFDAAPVQTYSECVALIEMAEEAIRQDAPEDIIVTASCVPSSKIGQNGI